MRHFFRDVSGLGDVVVSWHAEKRRQESGIAEDEFTDALYCGATVPHGDEEVLREYAGVRLVIKTHPEPYQGHALVVTAYKVGKARASLCESLAGKIRRNCQGLFDGSTEE